MSELGKVIEEAQARVDLSGKCGRPVFVEIPPGQLATLIAAAKRVEQAEAEVGRLRNKIERDPVWFVPGKIVAHAGRCFKLRADDEGPKIVLERVAAVTCRSGEVTPPQTANAGATTLEGAGGEVRADAPSEAVEGV